MEVGVIDRVLSVEEVRKNFKDVNEAALHGGAIIHYGERGADQLVIMSRATCEALMLERIQASAASAGPYAAFSRAVAEGRLGSTGYPLPRVRHRYPGNDEAKSSWSVEEMVNLGQHRDAVYRRPRSKGP